MSSGGEVVVEVAGRDVNLVALLTKVEAQMRQTDQQGIRLAQTTAGTYTAAQQRAANATLAEAQALARASVAVGENARAHQILVNALGQSAGASDRAVASVTAQVARLQGGSTAATQFGDAMKSGLLGIVGPAALVGTTLAAARGAVESFVQAFTFSAELQQQQTAINIQLRGIRDSGQVFQEATSFAHRYGFTQQEVTQAITDSLPVMRRSQSSMEDILGVFSRLIVLKPDKTFNDAARALSELQAGQATSIERIFNVPLKDANAMKKEIEGGADAVQVMSKYLESVGIGMDALEARTKGAIGAMNELKQAHEDLALAQAQFAQGPGMTLLQGEINVTRGATRLLSGDLDTMRQAIANAASQGSFGAVLFGNLATSLANIASAGHRLEGMINLNPLVADLKIVGAGVDGVTGKLNQLAGIQLPNVQQFWQPAIDSLQKWEDLLGIAPAATAAAVDAQQQQAAAAAAAVPVIQSSAQAELVHADAATAAAAALRDHGAATAALALQSQLTASAIAQATQAEAEHATTMEQDAAKAQIAGVESQTLAIRKQILTQQALAAANALIASGNAGAAAAGQLAASSSLVDQLTAAYLRLHAAQGVALQATTAQIAATRITRDESNAVEVLANKRSVAATQRRQEVVDYEKAQAAARRYQQEIGNFVPSIDRAERELALLPKGTEAYYNKAIEVQKLKQQQAAAVRKGGRGGAAEHLSDQQKLHNSLLADQEKYQDQAEAAEKQHNQRLLDIDRDYQKKSLEQQKKNEIDKRQSELDYLKALTGSELNATKEGQAEIQRINQRYYADFDAAQKAAQAGNTEQSQRMVEAARRRADMELRYAEEIEKARKDKNKGEIERLEALREKERQVLDEQDKQIKEGGDANVNARQEALDEEQRRYEEQQGKIQTASDNATERKINNALRSGKSIDEENVKLQKQEDILNRIGNRGAPTVAGSSTSAAPSTPGAASDTAAAAPAAIGLGAVVAAITALQPLLSDVKTAIETDTRLTTTAIRTAGSQRFVT